VRCESLLYQTADNVDVELLPSPENFRNGKLGIFWKWVSGIERGKNPLFYF